MESYSEVDGFGDSPDLTPLSLPNVTSLCLNDVRSEKNEGENQCLILNYEVFENVSDRPGSCFDVERLSNVFKQFGLAVATKQDLTTCETFKILNNISTHEYFVCCILTHGDDEGQLSTYDGSISVQDFVRIICSKIPPSKIKIIIIQACQGGKYDPGVRMRTRYKKKHIYIPVDNNSNHYGYKNSEVHENVILVASSYPGFVSFRHCEFGSYFIQALCTILERNYDQSDFMQILTMTNYYMAYYFESLNVDDAKHKKKQIPFIISSLQDSFYFKKIGSFEYATQKAANRYLRNPTFCPDMDDITYKKYAIVTTPKIQFCAVLYQDESSKGSCFSKASEVLCNYFERKKYNLTYIYKRTKKKMLERMSSCASKISHETECFICFLCTYSSEDFLLASNMKSKTRFLRPLIIEWFKGDNCPALVGKPKIFILLLCPTPEAMFDGDQRRNPSYKYDLPNPEIIPIYADFLVVVITVAESEIVETANMLVNSLQKYEGEDLVSILTKFNSELLNHQKKIKNQNETAPFFMSSTLTKNIILPSFTVTKKY